MITCFNARFAKKKLSTVFFGWKKPSIVSLETCSKDYRQQQNEKSIESFNQKVELIPLKLNSLYNVMTYQIFNQPNIFFVATKYLGEFGAYVFFFYIDFVWKNLSVTPS